MGSGRPAWKIEILLRMYAVAYSRHSASGYDGKPARAANEVWERNALSSPRPRSSGHTFRLRMNANILRRINLGSRGKAKTW